MVGVTNIDPNGVYGITQAAKLLGVATNTIRNYEASGRLRVYARQASSGKLKRAYKGRDLLRIWSI